MMASPAATSTTCPRGEYYTSTESSVEELKCRGRAPFDFKVIDAGEGTVVVRRQSLLAEPESQVIDAGEGTAAVRQRRHCHCSQFPR